MDIFLSIFSPLHTFCAWVCTFICHTWVTRVVFLTDFTSLGALGVLGSELKPSGDPKLQVELSWVEFSWAELGWVGLG